MKKLCLGILIAGAAILLAAQKDLPFQGRWDLTVTAPDGTYPSWMEISGDAGGPSVRVVGRGGSAHPVDDLKLSAAGLSFSTKEYYKGETKFVWNFHQAGHRVTGTQTRVDGTIGKITGLLAPALHREPPAAWSDPEPLFNGKDLAGWKPDNPSVNHWRVENGDLVNVEHGANLQTIRSFEDFKLHIEYNCPDGGNSGVYLRGRDEVQIEYEAVDANDRLHGMGSIYGFLPPATDVPKQPGQWESFDVTLVGRTVTVVRDKVLVIDNQEIPGITGGALDSHEGEPGPFYIQGDHTGGLRFRNITVSLPKP